MDPEGLPIYYYVSGGSMPPGLSLSAAGYITGNAIPPVASPLTSCGAKSVTSVFTIVAFDGQFSVTRSFSITVSTVSTFNSANYTTVGSFTFIAPNYQQPTVDVVVVGGGGGTYVCILRH